jgi:hypothetical protein
MDGGSSSGAGGRGDDRDDSRMKGKNVVEDQVDPTLSQSSEDSVSDPEPAPHVVEAPESALLAQPEAAQAALLAQPEAIPEANDADQVAAAVDAVLAEVAIVDDQLTIENDEGLINQLGFANGQNDEGMNVNVGNDVAVPEDNNLNNGFPAGINGVAVPVDNINLNNGFPAGVNGTNFWIFSMPVSTMLGMMVIFFIVILY